MYINDTKVKLFQKNLFKNTYLQNRFQALEHDRTISLVYNTTVQVWTKKKKKHIHT